MCFRFCGRIAPYPGASLQKSSVDSRERSGPMRRNKLGATFLLSCGLFALFVSATMAATTVRPEDCPSPVCGSPCDGFDNMDDTACWQWAIDTANTQDPDGASHFGTVEGTANATYYINDTLNVSDALAGTIDGKTEWDTVAEINAATTDDDLATLNAAEILSNKTLATADLTSSTNVFPSTGVLAFRVDNPGNGSAYGGPNTGVSNSTESIVALPLPRLLLDDMFCKSNSGPGGSRVWTVSLRVNGSTPAATLTCNLSGSGSPVSCSDSSHAVALGAGDEVALQVSKTAGSGNPGASTISCTIRARP